MRRAELRTRSSTAPTPSPAPVSLHRERTHGPDQGISRLGARDRRTADRARARLRPSPRRLARNRAMVPSMGMRKDLKSPILSTRRVRRGVGDQALRLERDRLRVRDLLLRLSRRCSRAVRGARPQGVHHQRELAPGLDDPPAVRHPRAARRHGIGHRAWRWSSPFPPASARRSSSRSSVVEEPREVLKIVIEFLAAIPSVVWGFIGYMVLNPVIIWATGAPIGVNVLNGARHSRAHECAHHHVDGRGRAQSRSRFVSRGGAGARGQPLAADLLGFSCPRRRTAFWPPRCWGSGGPSAKPWRSSWRRATASRSLTACSIRCAR